MSSVTSRVKEVKQPRGGYLNPKSFNVVQLNDGKELNANENVHPTVIGMVVDYMTRFMIDKDAKAAFSISLSGAYRAQLLTNGNQMEEAAKIFENIKDLDDNSIINACKMASFDVWARNPMAGPMSPTHKDINADKDTIENIRIMVNRGLNFIKEYGPIISDGFNFAPNGYTKTVDTGDGDYLTEDTMWDFKVSNKDITNKHTLQVLIYYVMGKHSGNEIYNNINKIGFFNPRLNKVYTLDMDIVSKDIIKEIETDVICY